MSNRIKAFSRKGGFRWLAVAASLAISVCSTVLAQVGPVITSHPFSVSTNTGATVVFSVGAAGTEPLRYQWRKNNVALPGETHARLTLQDVQGVDSGGYQVEVTNVSGATNSTAATLTVFVTVPDLLRITGQPLSQYVLRGSNVILHVTATGDPPLSYQWYYATNVTPVALPNETNSSLLLTNVLTSRSVWVGVSNSYGVTHSASARVEVRTNLACVGLPSQPLAATGWNADVIAENSLAPTVTPGGFDGVNWAWKEEGFLAEYPALFNRGGLPADGRLQSLGDTNVVFQLQPYGANNCLLLSGVNGWTRDLVLSPPIRLQTLAVLGAASGPNTGTTSSTVKLIFSDGTSTTNVDLGFPDWWDGAEIGRLVRRPAIAALGRVRAWDPERVLPDRYWWDLTGFSLHHADVDLRALGLTNRFLERLRFTGNAVSSVGIMAVSGSVIETMSPPKLTIGASLSQQTVHLQWTSQTTNVVVQVATHLGDAAAWVEMTNPPVVKQETNYSTTLPLETGERFFRILFP